MSKCKLQTVGLFHGYNLHVNIGSSNSCVTIFSFLVGRHFGLVGIEAFVEGLGLPLTWGMAVLDVLLPVIAVVFYVFCCKPNLH